MSKKFLLIAMLFLAATLQAADQDLKIGFDTNGLASLTYRDTVLVKPENSRWLVLAAQMLQPDGTVTQLWNPKPTARQFDAATATLTEQFPWGVVACRYVVTNTTLTLTLTVRNTGEKPISSLECAALRLHLPKRPANLNAEATELGTLLEHEAGRIAFFCSGPGSARTYLRGWAGSGTAYPIMATMATPPRETKHPIVDNRYFSDPGHLIAPGQTAELRIRLCFGELDATIESLAPRVYADYAKTHPMSLRWPDRRPIGTLFYAHPYKQWPTNPRGFNFGKGEKNDIFSEAGRVQFEAALMTCASQCVANLKAMDAQGVIIWDLEGEEKPHAISYVGDPRMLPAVAPEIDRVADAFMKTFSDAGMKIGITLRPTEYYERTPGKRDWSHREVADPVALLSSKIQYARKRWGCTLFYIDSNVFGKEWVDLPKEANVPWVMPVGMLEALHAKYPDCLIIPEWSGADYHRYSAPYASCNLGQLGTRPVNRKIWPEAFTVVAVSKSLLESKLGETYLTNVQGGDVLLFPCWYSPSENTLVKLLYREAAYRREAVSSALSKAALPEVLSRAATPEEAVRYQAAVRLGDFTTPEALRQTAAALDDASLLVRKAALGSIARQGAVSEPAVIDRLVALFQSKAPDAAVLRAFVGTALGCLGEPAVTPLIALAGKKGPAQPHAVQALGVTGTRDPQAVATLLPLVQDPKDAALREAAVGALGALRAKDAVSALLALLDEPKNSETLRKEAVIALGRIGDARAVEALVREHARPYSSMVIYSIHRTLDEALSALTGQTTLIGRDDWQQWWAAQPRSPTP